MNRVKKQLHEWDENLKDDSLPTNAVGQPLFSVPQMDPRSAHMRTYRYVLCTHSSSFVFIHLLFFLSGFCQTSLTEWPPVCP